MFGQWGAATRRGSREAADIARVGRGALRPDDGRRRRRLRPDRSRRRTHSRRIASPNGVDTLRRSTMEVMTDIALRPATSRRQTPASNRAPERRARGRAARRARARRRDPGVQRAGRAGRFGAPAAPPPARAAFRSRCASRSPTTPASTTPRASPRSWQPSSTDVRVVRLEEKGRGRALHAGVVDVRRPGAGLHGRRPVDRPRGAGSAGRPADLRALRSRDRHPAGPRARGWCAAPSASSSRAATT